MFLVISPTRSTTIEKKVPLCELWDPAPYTKGPRRSLAHPCNRHGPYQCPYQKSLLAMAHEPENTVLDNRPWTGSPCGSSIFQWRSYSILLEPYNDMTHGRGWEELLDFTCIISLALISPGEKGRAWEWVLGFPTCVRGCLRGPALSHSIQSSESWAVWVGGKSLGQKQIGFSESI